MRGVLSVFARKNPLVLTVLARKKPARSQKTLVRVRVDRVRSQKPLVDRVLTVLALKNCSCSLSKTRVVLIVLALKNPGGGFGI